MLNDQLCSFACMVCTCKTMQLQKSMMINKTVWECENMMISKNSMKIKDLKTSTTVYCSLVNWERVYHIDYCTFFVQAFPNAYTLISLVQSWFSCGSLQVSWGNKATLTSVGGAPLWLSGSILCQGRWWTGHQRTWHGGVHTHYIPPMVLLPWLSSMSSCGSHSVHYTDGIYGLRHLSLHPDACMIL